MEFAYPVLTDVRHINDSPVKRRRVVVRKIRDLKSEPLTVEEFLRRPFIAKSRWLMQAWDADIKKRRNFYLGSCDRFRSPGTLRIAMFQPDQNRLIDYIGRQFDATLADRASMLSVINDFRQLQHEAIANRIRMFSPDELIALPPVPELRIVAEDLRLIA